MAKDRRFTDHIRDDLIKMSRENDKLREELEKVHYKIKVVHSIAHTTLILVAFILPMIINYLTNNYYQDFKIELNLGFGWSFDFYNFLMILYALLLFYIVVVITTKKNKNEDNPKEE